MSVTILRGNALALPLDNASVDLAVTSPPYFGLRSYQDGGEHYAGQIGAEATPAEFVDALIAATCEMIRVLKPSGSIWVNLGDKYVSSPPGNTRSLTNTAEHQQKQKASYDRTWRVPEGLKQKSLMGIPWRYAIRCIDELGLILRAEVIWSKPNGLPESVTDRVRRSHETWFHFTKSPRYFAAVDEIREPHLKAEGDPRPMGTRNKTPRHTNAADYTGWKDHSVSNNPVGKLPGSVWTIPTQPLTVPPELGIDHFAAFPMEWPRRIIAGWSPSGVCTACGEGRRPLTQRAGGRPVARAHRHLPGYSDPAGEGMRDQTYTITGYACACVGPQVDVEVSEYMPTTETGDYKLVTHTVQRTDPAWRNPAPTAPAVVLDPFGGTGTTALVADALGRHGVSVDMSADYCRLAEWRTADPGQRAAAAGVEKVDPVHPDQLDLFGDVA